MAKKINNLNHLISFKTNKITGEIAAPSDKSISHRALLFSSLSIGLSKISNLLESDDVLNMVRALKSLGVKITKSRKNWLIQGVGLTGFEEPTKKIDCGNSGTLVRILMGALSNNNITVNLTGDQSLIKRPMDRIVEPLTSMGVNFITSNNKLPITIKGNSKLIPIKYKLPVSSAQIKTSILLAGLNTMGITEIIEPYTSRNHSENLLKYFGAKIKFNSTSSGVNRVLIEGGNILMAKQVNIPGDISSAAFTIVAASIIPNSKIRILNVGINIYRIGILDALELMGADIKKENIRINEFNEPISDINVSYSKLKPLKLNKSFSSKMIDEYPILAIAAATATGKSVFRGLSELRHKESDRFEAIIEGLNKCGVLTSSKNDDIIIHGNRNKIKGGVTIDCKYDHRIAMAFIILGTISKKPIEVVGCNSIITSYPNFYDQMRYIGLNVEVKK
tara:strand:+ start:310 stop:1656 length:1347 start_codon:yes stop_codon:yes gene_type:complete